MGLSLFMYFDGNTKEVVEFYAKVFKSKVEDFMLFGDIEPSSDPSFQIAEEDKDKVMFASVNIMGTDVMFCDNPLGEPLIRGNNFSPTVVSKDADEIKRIFNELSEGGVIEMELQQTFWSELYGMVTDKFGTDWQLSHDSGKEYMNQ